jgi:hypothetical protein
MPQARFGSSARLPSPPLYRVYSPPNGKQDCGTEIDVPV